MALKKHKNTELSRRLCQNCGKPLKLNLLDKIPDANLCWKCWYPLNQKQRGGHMQGRLFKPSLKAIKVFERKAI